MGQVLYMSDYRKSGAADEILAINKLNVVLGNLRNTLYTSGDYLERERAAIQMSVVQMEIKERCARLGLSE